MTPSPPVAVKCAVVVLAGGTGSRLGHAGGKQLAVVAGRPILAWSLEALDRSGVFDLVVVVCPAERRDEYAAAVRESAQLTAPVVWAPSGTSRQESALSGIAAVPASFDIIALHDGARPLVDPVTVSRATAHLAESDVVGVVLGHPAIDTLKSVVGTRVTATLDRATVWHAQTPQIFRAAQLRHAYQLAAATGFVGTDDAAIVQHAGGVVEMFESPRDNLKVTVESDLAFVSWLLSEESGSET